MPAEVTHITFEVVIDLGHKPSRAKGGQAKPTQPASAQTTFNLKWAVLPHIWLFFGLG